jgi:hypothetical protein
LSDLLWEEKLLEDESIICGMGLLLDAYNYIGSIIEEDEVIRQVNPFSMKVMMKLIRIFKVKKKQIVHYLCFCLSC